MAVITLDGVSRIFPNGHAAIRDMTLEIADHERLVVVGPSGSGKSTVLRLIAGLDVPTSGRILIDGRDVTRVPPQERDIAMVFQHYALYPHKNVRENLAFSLRLRRRPSADIEARVAAVSAMLGLDALLDRKPAQLSGGQRQRVALGRAIVREPKAFLLDEPLSNLDPGLRTETRTELTLLHRRLQTTMVYVTHDQEEAMTLGTRIAVMRDGIVEQVDAPLDLYRRPSNVFVAAFVGSPAMNLWPCECSVSAETTRFASPAFACDTERLPGLSAGARRPVVLGIRPHDLELTAESDGDGRGRVEVVEPLGAATLVHLRSDVDPDLRLLAVAAPDTALAVDRAVGFRLRRDRLHVFDRGSGRRLE